MRRLLSGRVRAGRGAKLGSPRLGSTLLEAALALAVLTPLAVMAGQYAWGYYQYQSLHAVVEEAARFGASADMQEGEGAWIASVRQYALCGSVMRCEHSRLGLRPENVQVEFLRTGQAPASVRVAIQGFTIALPGSSKRFDGAPSAQFPRLEPAP
jgi:hypothetical protein